MHYELPIAAFTSCVLVLIPLPWHWRAGTVATISISFWLFVSNFINGINSIIWADNFRETALTWCDIATKIFLGANVALPASIFCLCVHLERVSSVRQVRTNLSQKRRRQLFDAILCFGVPIIYMALHYIVQGHRFDIVEGFGCRASIYVSLESVFVLWVPPLFFSCGSFILSAMALRNFWIRRITFARHLQDSNSALTPARYFRLMSMAFIQMFWGVLVIALSMWFTMKGGLRPWLSWEDVHFNFSRIGLFPTFFIPPQELLFTYLLWWTLPASSVLFFIFFAFGQEAMKEYRACFAWVKHKVFRIPPPSPKAKKLASMPVFNTGYKADRSSTTKSDSTQSISPASPQLPPYTIQDSDFTTAYIHDIEKRFPQTPDSNTLSYYPPSARSLSPMPESSYHDDGWAELRSSTSSSFSPDHLST